MRRIQRTLIFSLGQAAAEIAGQSLAELQGLPAVQHLDVQGLADAPETEDAVLTALQAISNASVQSALAARGYTLDRLDEICLWLLCDVQTAETIEPLVCVRQRAMDMAWNHFRCIMSSHALVISTPHLNEATTTVLDALQSLPQPLDSLLLVSTVNADGLTVDAHTCWQHLGAALAQMLTTSLRNVTASLYEQIEVVPPWEGAEAVGEPGPGGAGVGGEQGGRYQTPPLLSMGASVYQHPGDRLISYLARTWAQGALSRLLAASEPETGHAGAELPFPAALIPWQPARREAELAVQFAPATLPEQALARSGWVGQSAVLRGLVGAYEQAVKESKAVMQAAPAHMDLWLQAWQAALAEMMEEALDAAAGLPHLARARARLQAYEHTCVSWTAQMDQRLAEASHKRERGLAALAEAQARLELCAASLETPTWREALRILFNPRSWSSLLQTYLALPDMMKEYIRSANAALAAEARARRYDLLRQHYLACTGAVMEAGRRLDQQIEAMHAGLRLLQESPVAWQDAILDAEACQRLYAEILADGGVALHHCLRQRPLNTWPHEGEAVVEALLAFGQRWLAPLATWGADRFVAFALDDDVAAMAGWLDVFRQQATPLWPDGDRPPAQQIEVEAWVVAEPETSPFLSLLAVRQPSPLIVWGSARGPLAALRFHHQVVP